MKFKELVNFRKIPELGGDIDSRSLFLSEIRYAYGNEISCKSR